MSSFLPHGGKNLINKKSSILLMIVETLWFSQIFSQALHPFTMQPGWIHDFSKGRRGGWYLGAAESMGHAP